MRRPLLFFLTLFTLSTASTYSQGYQKMLTANKFWDVLGSGSMYPMCYTGYIHRLRISGDTLINNTLYRKFNYQEFKSYNGYPFCPPYYVDTTFKESYAPYLREDSLAQKVFLYEPGTNPAEKVLYDFTLNVGDTINQNVTLGLEVVILDIDTIYFADSIPRRKYVLDNNTDYIEGVGGNTGIGQPLAYGIGVGTSLYCYSEDGMEPFGSCNYDLVTVSERDNSPIRIYPNPSQSFFYIDADRQMKGLLFDISGREVLKFDSKKVSVDDLHPGVYLVRFDGEQSSVSKLIVID